MATHATQLGEGPYFQYGRKYVWEAPVRLTHWVNAISIPVLVLTGLLIARPQLTPLANLIGTSGWAASVRFTSFLRML
jgi:Ni/Fe-hydrogenase 1 B-type cytochrome subunit